MTCFDDEHQNCLFRFVKIVCTQYHHANHILFVSCVCCTLFLYLISFYFVFININFFFYLSTTFYTPNNIVFDFYHKYFCHRLISESNGVVFFIVSCFCNWKERFGLKNVFSSVTVYTRSHNKQSFLRQKNQINFLLLNVTKTR